MSVPNFSSLAGLEVTEKFVGGGGFQVSTMSNPTKLLLQLLWVELSWVTLGFDDKLDGGENEAFTQAHYSFMGGW